MAVLSYIHISVGNSPKLCQMYAALVGDSGHSEKPCTGLGSPGTHELSHERTEMTDDYEELVRCMSTATRSLYMP